MDKNKTTNLFGQTLKRCLAAAGDTFPTTNRNFQTTVTGWRSSTWKFQATNGPKSIYETNIHEGEGQPRKYPQDRRRPVRYVFLEFGALWYNFEPAFWRFAALGSRSAPARARSPSINALICCQFVFMLFVKFLPPISESQNHHCSFQYELGSLQPSGIL